MVQKKDQSHRTIISSSKTLRPVPVVCIPLLVCEHNEVDRRRLLSAWVWWWYGLIRRCKWIHLASPTAIMKPSYTNIWTNGELTAEILFLSFQHMYLAIFNTSDSTSCMHYSWASKVFCVMHRLGSMRHRLPSLGYRQTALRPCFPPRTLHSLQVATRAVQLNGVIIRIQYWDFKLISASIHAQSTLCT